MAPGKSAEASFLRAAADRLGLQSPVAPDAARAAVLQKLRDDDYLPDPATHEAILAVSGRRLGNVSLLADDLTAETGRLLEQIEEFATGFFTIPPPDRVEHWRALHNTCEGRESLLARLRDLEPGLSLDPASIIGGSPVAARLIDDVLALFVLPLEARAPRSRELAMQFREDPALTDLERYQARRELVRRHRDIARLSPVYLKQVARHPSPWMLGRLYSWYRTRANRRYLRRQTP